MKGIKKLVSAGVSLLIMNMGAQAATSGAPVLPPFSPMLNLPVHCCNIGGTPLWVKGTCSGVGGSEIPPIPPVPIVPSAPETLGPNLLTNPSQAVMDAFKAWAKWETQYNPIVLSAWRRQVKYSYVWYLYDEEPGQGHFAMNWEEYQAAFANTLTPAGSGYCLSKNELSNWYKSGQLQYVLKPQNYASF